MKKIKVTGLPKAPPRWAIATLLGLPLLATAWLLSPLGESAVEPARPVPPAARSHPEPGLQPARATATPAQVPVPASIPVATETAPSGSAAVAAAVEPAPLPVQNYPDSETVLFVTIIGDQTYYHWGRVGDRPPRIDGFAVNGSPAATDAVAVATQTLSAAVSENATGAAENPYGPAPQECPRTLPPGSSQATADSLRASSGCRYLSSCSVDNQECTWFYQGRG